MLNYTLRLCNGFFSFDSAIICALVTLWMIQNLVENCVKSFSYEYMYFNWSVLMLVLTDYWQVGLCRSVVIYFKWIDLAMKTKMWLKVSVVLM